MQPGKTSENGSQLYFTCSQRLFMQILPFVRNRLKVQNGANLSFKEKERKILIIDQKKKTSESGKTGKRNNQTNS